MSSATFASSGSPDIVRSRPMSISIFRPLPSPERGAAVPATFPGRANYNRRVRRRNMAVARSNAWIFEINNAVNQFDIQAAAHADAQSAAQTEAQADDQADSQADSLADAQTAAGLTEETTAETTTHITPESVAEAIFAARAAAPPRRVEEFHVDHEGHDFDFEGMVDGYHELTVKLTDINSTKKELRRRLQIRASKKWQQLNLIRRQMDALKNIRDKRVIASGSIIDLRRALKWQANIVRQQLKKAQDGIDDHVKRVRQIFHDSMDATRYQYLADKIAEYDRIRAATEQEDSGADLAEVDLSTLDIGENLRTHADIIRFVHSLTTVDHSLMIPDWFSVVEARKAIPLLGKGVNFRFVELTNKMHRLYKEMQEEQRFLAEESVFAHSSDYGSDFGSPVRRAEGNTQGDSVDVSDDPPPIIGHPVEHSFFSEFTAKDEYEELMGQINKCMATVAEWDRNVVRARFAMEDASFDLEDYVFVDPDDDLYGSD